jgi:hypothetical protein
MHKITVDFSTIYINGVKNKLPVNDIPIRFVIQGRAKGGNLYVITSEEDGGGNIYMSTVKKDNTLDIFRIEGHNLAITDVQLVSLPRYESLHHKYDNFITYGIVFSGCAGTRCNPDYTKGVRIVIIDFPYLVNNDLATELYIQKLESSGQRIPTFDEFSLDESGCQLDICKIRCNYDKMIPDIYEGGRKVPTYERGELITTLDLTEQLRSIGIDFEATMALQNEYEILRF